VLMAAGEVADQLRRLTADELEAAVDDIELVDGHARVVGSPSRQIAIAALAAKAHDGELLLGRGSGAPGEAPALRGSTCIGDLGMAAFLAPQFSCHAVHLRLDRDTGVARVLAVSAAHDSGTILNPQGAEGQVEGGVMMGIGQALTEGTRLDDAGRQRNPMLLEYKLQTIMDAPPIRIAWVQSPAQDGGPHGAKGLAEAPNVTTAAAIGNAIAKLIGRHVQQLPMTAERVWEAMSR
jgi:CO/xanthine dehydrogenase Mo-binding subunit